MNTIRLAPMFVMLCAGHIMNSGCLFSYGPLLGEFAKTTAQQVDKILKGAKASEMPVQQMTRFELVINRTTARALGISIPGPVGARADKIID